MSQAKLDRYEIDLMVKEQRWGELRSLLVDSPAPEITELLADLEKTDRVIVFRLLPRPVANEVFSLLDPSHQNGLLEDMADEEARSFLSHLTPDDRTALLEELPAQVTQRLLDLLPDQVRRSALTLLGYPEGSVGRLMTTRYVAVRPEWTVARALDQIRARGSDSETISMVYVIDDEGRLIDDLRLRRFILADPESRVESLLERTFASLSSFQDQEEAVKMFRKYDLFALPVIDSEGILLGIVTADDVLDVAEEEATEDFHKGAAIAPLDFSYRNTAVWALVQRRLPWLVILVFVNLVSSGIIAAYEETLTAVITLAFFIPLLIDSGGNTGSQSATLIVRALSTGDLRLEQWVRALRKEVMVGVGLGAAMGLASAGLGAFRGGPVIGLIVGISMFMIVLAANLIGLLLPFILTRLRIDPAVASSPLVTSIADAVGLFLYFGVATLLIGVLA